MDTHTRRGVLASGAAAVGAALAGCAGGRSENDGSGGSGAGDGDTSGDPDESDAAGSAVAARPVASGFASPVGIEFAPGRDGLFVVDQPGRVVHVRDGERRQYLDLRERVVDLSGYDERGLLGLAFHPRFADNGRLYVRYSAPRRSGTPTNFSHTFVLAELTVDPAAEKPTAEERTVLEIPQPQANHNAGSVVFGPDGYLYVGVGDGGGADDVGRGHVDDWYDAVDGGNGQDVEQNLLGSVLRIDVDARDAGAYGVPDDNPLVGRAGLDEQFAWGFRNPWRMSFHGEDLYVADVGQNRYEEVNVVEKGGNYGWNVREATHCFGDVTACPTSTTASAATGATPLEAPVVEYPHGGDAALSGVSVIGGYRYDGPLAALDARYVFADWRAGGRLFTATPSEERPWETGVVDVSRLGAFVLAFGYDGTDLYVATADGAGTGGSDGAVVRLVAE